MARTYSSAELAARAFLISMATLAAFIAIVFIFIL
jgi:hypothetical protein